MMIEQLEGRRLFFGSGEVYACGTPDDDQIVICGAGAAVSVEIGTFEVADDHATSVRIETNGGNDEVHCFFALGDVEISIDGMPAPLGA